MTKHWIPVALMILAFGGFDVAHAGKAHKAPTSVAAQLEAEIAATPNGGTLDLTGKTFHIGYETINVDNRVNLTIIGGTIIRDHKTEAELPPNFDNATHHSCRMFNFKLCKGLTLRKITLIGSRGDDLSLGYQVHHEGHHGFGFTCCSDVVCDHLVVKNVPGDGMYFGSAGGNKNNVPCKNVVVSGFDLYNSGRHGIALCGIDGIVIKDKTSLRGFHRHAIDREVQVHDDVQLNVVVAADTIKCSAKQILSGKCK